MCRNKVVTNIMDKKIRRDLLKDYLSGYINQYYEFKDFIFKNSTGDYRNFKLKLSLNYLGIGKSINWPFKLYGVISFIELLVSTIFVICKFFISTLHKARFKGRTITNKCLTPGLEISASRFKKLYSVVECEIITIKIPYRSNEYDTPKISVYEGIEWKDIYLAFCFSLRTIFYMYHKFRKRDILYRNYSSFEYYLTCLFVLRNPQNHYVFHNQIDKWALFFSNVSGCTFIQHGKIEGGARLIKISPPKKAYYLNDGQKRILETVLFKTPPENFGFRPHLSFTHNEKLIANNKKNILIISGLDFLEEEIPIIMMLKDKDINMYLKPHPKDKVLTRYHELRDNFGVILLEKDDFPEVDVVVSYNSTLAYEYEDAGVKVIRYDLLNDLNRINDHL